MKKIILILLGLVLMFGLFGVVSAADLNVDNSGTCNNVSGDPYCTIQAAIDAATTSDTINVAAGTYDEQVVVDKQLTLNGANADVNAVTGTRGSESTIDGGTSTAITISADDVIVDGFELDGGITLDDTANTISGGVISNNLITGADNPDPPIKAQNGIRLGWDYGVGVDHVTIENNIISDNGDNVKKEGKGIRFANTKEHKGGPPQHTSYITISGNKIEDNVSAGIETYGPGSNTIINNTISDNGGNGINLKFDDGDEVRGNTITDNDGPGITLRQVTNTTVENNSVSDHKSGEKIKTCDTVPGGKGSGIHIFDTSEDNTIRFNDISDNNYGIFIHSKGDLQPSGNSINFNNIAGNINYGILNALVDLPTPVDATNNWWGDATGPKQATTSPCASGDEVSNNVEYTPWLDAVYPDGSERSYNVVNITSSTIYNCIQEAIDAATTSDTINVAAGTYNLIAPIAVTESVTITGDIETPSNVVINAPTTGSDRDCFQVQVSDVIIQGFRMQNSYDQESESGLDGGENGGVMIGNNSFNTIMYEPGQIRDLSHVTVTHCEFDYCSYGVYVYEAGDNITIDYNDLTRVWRPVIFYGWESGGTGLHTCNNSISHNTMDGAGYPFYVNRGDGYSDDGSAENRGIEFGHGPPNANVTIDVQGLSITHNEISNYIRHAVILGVAGVYGTFNGAADNYINISHNTITHTADDVTTGQGRHTVEVWGDYVHFSHNTVTDHAWFAFCGLNSHYEVHDNVISNTVPQLNAGHVAAIIVGNDADVYNNTLSGGLTGITLYGNRADVYNNTISGYASTSSDGKGGNGIFLYSVGVEETINIYDNDISGCLIGIRDEASPAGLGINFNNIVGNTLYGIENTGITEIDATNNWWGSAKPDFNTIISGNVNYSPWYANQEMTSLAGTPDENNQLTLPTEVSINVTTTVGDVTVKMPAELTVTGEKGWNGEINAPEVKEISSVTIIPESGTTVSVSAVIEIGYGDIKLTFNQAVRISIAGQAGKYAGYSRAGVFTPITTICTADTQAAGDALPAEGDCKRDVGSDLVIWTKHFTKFVTYSQTTVPPSGGTIAFTGDTTAPSISEINVVAGSNTAIITWQTNEQSISWLVYGETTDYGLEEKTTTYKTSHSVTLTNLSPLTTYHYQIKSKDSSGNIGTHTDRIFTTPALEEEITGDINDDGKVDIFDFNLSMVNWGDSPANLAADLDDNGRVDISDFNLLIVNWTK